MRFRRIAREVGYEWFEYEEFGFGGEGGGEEEGEEEEEEEERQGGIGDCGGEVNELLLFRLSGW